MIIFEILLIIMISLFVFFIFGLIIMQIVNYSNYKEIMNRYKNKSHISIELREFKSGGNSFFFGFRENIDVILKYKRTPNNYIEAEIIYLNDFQSFEILANIISCEENHLIYFIKDECYVVDKHILVGYEKKLYVINTNYKTFRKIKKYFRDTNRNHQKYKNKKEFEKQIQTSIKLFQKIADDNKKLGEKEIQEASDIMDEIKMRISEI